MKIDIVMWEGEWYLTSDVSHLRPLPPKVFAGGSLLSVKKKKGLEVYSWELTEKGVKAFQKAASKKLTKKQMIASVSDSVRASTRPSQTQELIPTEYQEKRVSQSPTISGHNMVYIDDPDVPHDNIVLARGGRTVKTVEIKVPVTCHACGRVENIPKSDADYRQKMETGYRCSKCIGGRRGSV